MRRFFLPMTLVALASLLFSTDVMAQPKPKPAAGKALYPLLPPGPGRDVEIRVCSQCHTPERPSAERHDLAGWNSVIDQMVNNGATASDADFDQIAHYLAVSFPPGKKK